jgi:hypothetical protein
MMGRRSLINRRSTAHQSNSVKSPSQSKAADFFDSIDPKQTSRTAFNLHSFPIARPGRASFSAQRFPAL